VSAVRINDNAVPASKHYAMKVHKGLEENIHAVLTNAVDKGQRSASRSVRSAPRKQSYVLTEAGRERGGDRNRI
jgi:hypothetical protein